MKLFWYSKIVGISWIDNDRSFSVIENDDVHMLLICDFMCDCDTVCLHWRIHGGNPAMAPHPVCQ